MRLIDRTWSTDYATSVTNNSSARQNEQNKCFLVFVDCCNRLSNTITCRSDFSLIRTDLIRVVFGSVRQIGATRTHLFDIVRQTPFGIAWTRLKTDESYQHPCCSGYDKKKNSVTVIIILHNYCRYCSTRSIKYVPVCPLSVKIDGKTHDNNDNLTLINYVVQNERCRETAKTNV